MSVLVGTSIFLLAVAAYGRINANSPRLRDASRWMTRRDLFDQLSSISMHWSHPEAREIHKGAYCIVDDDGRLFRQWRQHRGAKIVITTHYALSCCYAIHYDDSDVDKIRSHGVLVFGQNKDRHTWFQLEQYAVRTHPLKHAMTLVKYKVTGRNVGPRGSSVYTESNPLTL